MLTNFLSGPQGRTKDVVPDLLLLIGYLVSLPAKTVAELFKSQGKLHSLNNYFFDSLVEDMCL